MRTMQQAAAARPLGVSSTLQRNHTSLILQREAGAHASGAAQPDLVHGVLNSPGRPLDSSTRDFMEPKLGHDLSGVRVHSDDAAARAAQSVRANAFTAGNHVVFDSGRYAPGTQQGRHLLAHELTHVAQQARGPVSGTPIGGGLSVSDPHDSFEREARANADRMDASAPARAAQGLTPLPAERQGDANIQRDAAGVIGAVAGVASVGLAVAALVYAIKAWKHPANAQPTVGGATVNSQNPIVAIPDEGLPESAKEAAVKTPAQRRKVLDMRTDKQNYLDINLGIVSDGVSVFSAVPEIESTGYAGGTDGSTAVLNIGSPTVLSKPKYAPAPEPVQEKKEDTAAKTPAKTPAPKGGGKGKKDQKAEPEKQADPKPPPKASDLPALIQVPFTGVNSVNETKPQQQFAGRFIVRGNGLVECLECYPANHIGYAAPDTGKIGHVDYDGHPGVTGVSKEPAATPKKTPDAPGSPDKPK